MSISLPNGTLLATPAQQVQYTAAVTRILHLANFSADLKTRDLQAMFKEYESAGFRIKWIDDTNALVVFTDPHTAKRAYLTFLLSPPANFTHPAKISPYDRPDANQIIQALNARAMGHRNSISNYSQQVPMGMGMGLGTNGSVGGVEGLPGMGMAAGGGQGQGQGHGRAGSFAKGAGGASGSWTFPTRQNSGGAPSSSGVASSSTSSQAPNQGQPSRSLGMAGHGRTGSATFSRSAIGGVGSSSSVPSTGAIAPSVPRIGTALPTHTESIDSPAIPAGFSTSTQPGVGGGSSRRLTGRHGGAGGTSMGLGMGIGSGAMAFGQRNIGAVGSSTYAPSQAQARVPLERPTSRTTDSARSGDSSDNEPIVIMDEPSWSAAAGGHTIEGRGKVPFGQWKMPPSQSPNPNRSPNPDKDIEAQRRNSVSADKALREVQKALASVEAQG